MFQLVFDLLHNTSNTGVDTLEIEKSKGAGIYLVVIWKTNVTHSVGLQEMQMVVVNIWKLLFNLSDFRRVWWRKRIRLRELLKLLRELFMHR